MSGKALNKDTKCRSFGFVNNPPRGYFRTVKTCASDSTKPTAFALILSRKVNSGNADLSPPVDPIERDDGPKVDDIVSQCNIESVEFVTIDNDEPLVQGVYRITYKPGTFQEVPVVQVTPCESFVLEEFSFNFPSEQTVAFCQANTKDYAIIMTGRAPFMDSLTIPVLGPPELRDDVSFNFFAIARK